MHFLLSLVLMMLILFTKFSVTKAPTLRGVPNTNFVYTIQTQELRDIVVDKRILSSTTQVYASSVVLLIGIDRLVDGIDESFTSIFFSMFRLIECHREKFIEDQRNGHKVTPFAKEIGHEFCRRRIRSEFHEMIKQNRVNLGTEKKRYHQLAQKPRTGPPIRDREIKNQGIQNPKHVCVYAGSFDEPLRALVKVWIVRDTEIVGILDKEYGAVGIQGGTAVFSFHGIIHQNEDRLEYGDGCIQKHFPMDFTVLSFSV
mmetsp:Transcript_3722/g.9743  ORF Transcript_3722/g.9743 Transcript_3722/m.9743 type:complete len:257 (-) Transcript_3722:93-863(-)